MTEETTQAWSPSTAAASVGYLVAVCARENERWWQSPATGEPIERNIGQMLMLCVSELAEALEGDRKSLPDTHLPHRPMFEVELADCLIRIFDLAGHTCADLAGAFVEKLEYNRRRLDHQHEARLEPGGKKY